MKGMKRWGWLSAALLLATGGTAGRAEGFAIQSFDGTGQLVFTAVEGATNYEIRTSAAITGAWSVAGSVLPTGANALTTTVSVAGGAGFCKVVAFTNAAPPQPEGMVLIPAGSFSMGSSADGFIAELPVHTVYVSAFYIDRYEVTKALWDEVRAWGLNNGYTDLWTGRGKAANHPVHTINWYAMVKWCNARSEKEGRTPCYTVSGSVYKTGVSTPDCNWSASGYRLPTEAEWEKAARGGLSGERFPWGATIQHSRANYNSSSYSYDTSPTRGYHPDYDDGGEPYTSPVGSFAPNGYGLYDMAGNVWELCWDVYGVYYYGSSPGTDPRGPTSGSSRVRRGGGWHFYALFCRVTDRYIQSPDGSGNDGGFRACLPP